MASSLVPPSGPGAPQPSHPPGGPAVTPGATSSGMSPHRVAAGEVSAARGHHARSFHSAISDSRGWDCEGVSSCSLSSAGTEATEL